MSLTILSIGIRKPNYIFPVHLVLRVNSSIYHIILVIKVFQPEHGLGASHLIPMGGGGPGFDPRVFLGFFSWGWSTFCFAESGVLFFLK